MGPFPGYTLLEGEQRAERRGPMCKQRRAHSHIFLYLVRSTLFHLTSSSLASPRYRSLFFFSVRQFRRPTTPLLFSFAGGTCHNQFLSLRSGKSSDRECIQRSKAMLRALLLSSTLTTLRYRAMRIFYSTCNEQCRKESLHLVHTSFYHDAPPLPVCWCAHRTHTCQFFHGLSALVAFRLFEEKARYRGRRWTRIHV